MPGQRVATPRRPGRVGPDVVAGGEAAPLGAEHDHPRRRVAVGLVEALDERALQIGADGVELVGPVERDDADAAVDGVGHELRGHGNLLTAPVPAVNPAAPSSHIAACLSSQPAEAGWRPEGWAGRALSSRPG